MTSMDSLVLTAGSHDGADDGMCLMEAVAYFSGETHTDMPACVSPKLALYGRCLNDDLPHGQRQKLKQFIPKLSGTAGDGMDLRRAYMAVDWIVRTYIAVLIEAAGIDATAIKSLPPLRDPASVHESMILLTAVKEKTNAIAGNHWSDSYNAAGAFKDSTGFMAVSGASFEATMGLDRHRVWNTVQDTALSAAFAVAWVATNHQMASIVEQLQESAIQLFGAMIAPEGNKF